MYQDKRINISVTIKVDQDDRFYCGKKCPFQYDSVMMTRCGLFDSGLQPHVLKNGNRKRIRMKRCKKCLKAELTVGRNV